MFCQYLNDTKLITAYGPFIAAFFTGLITIIAVIISSNATRRASKIQSEATLSSLTKSLNFEAKNQKLKILHEALAECLTKLYLIARDPNVFTRDTEAIFLAIAKFDTLLSSDYNEIKIKKLLSTLRVCTD